MNSDQAKQAYDSSYKFGKEQMYNYAYQRGYENGYHDGLNQKNHMK